MSLLFGYFNLQTTVRTSEGTNLDLLFKRVDLCMILKFPNPCIISKLYVKFLAGFTFSSIAFKPKEKAKLIGGPEDVLKRYKPINPSEFIIVPSFAMSFFLPFG